MLDPSISHKEKFTVELENFNDESTETTLGHLRNSLHEQNALISLDPLLKKLCH